MDSISEGSSGARVLAARHISADKVLVNNNNAINTTLLCHSFSVQPDFLTYFTALQPYAWILWSCCLLGLIVTCILYFGTLRSVARHSRGSLADIAIVLSVYPVVSTAAFVTLMVPRSRIMAEAVAQQSVMIAMYHLFWMIIADCGGVSQLIRRAAGARLETRVLPCCCWPCCIIPRPMLHRSNLIGLSYLVLQMPIVQAIIYLIMLVLWAENMSLFQRSFVFFQPFVAMSILLGVWGTIMCVRAAESAGARPRAKFVALQLVLLIVKLQCGFAKIFPEIVDLPCILPLNPTVFLNTIHYALMILEMLILAVWAWRLYSVPTGKVTGKVPSVVVAVLDESSRKKDGVDNKCYDTREIK